MPTLKHLTCQVLDGISGKPLQEWAPQAVKKDEVVSCFIQADTGRPFTIKITHEMPFPPIQEEIMQAEGLDYLHSGERMPKRDRAPWHLLATLRFDGRTKAEKRSIIYLDKNHQYFRSKTTMEGRSVPGEDGNLWWHRWIFNEVGLGIDSLLEDMSLAPSGKERDNGGVDDELAGLLNGLDPKCEDKEETSKAGLLEITFERCVVAEKSFWEDYRPERGEENMDEGEKAGKDISHTATADVTGRKSSSKQVHYIDYVTPDGGEAYAVFKFKYRGEDVLRKFGFTGFPKKVEVPNDSFGKLKLEGLGNKRSKRSSADVGDEKDEGSPTKAKRTTFHSPKNDKREVEFAPKHEDGDSDSDMEEETQTFERQEMKKEDLDYFSKSNAIKHEAPKETGSGDSDKENQPNDQQSTNKDTKKDTFKGLTNFIKHDKIARLASGQAIRSNMEDDDADDEADTPPASIKKEKATPPVSVKKEEDVEDVV